MNFIDINSRYEYESSLCQEIENFFLKNHHNEFSYVEIQYVELKLLKTIIC